MTEVAEALKGRRIASRYTLLEKLGAGGQGEVWRAHDSRRNTDIALKVLVKSSSGADANATDDRTVWKALEHEYSIASQLDHPSILKVFAPERADDVLMLPMELAPGGDLRRLRGASFLEVIPVLLQVAHALEHAHARGIVHRDLKPGNVLFDAAGHARLADFGAAEPETMPEPFHSSLSLPRSREPNRQALSPFTASPAQLRGEPPNAADDVYGLGALAYELLSGYPPYYPTFDRRRAIEEPVPPLVPKTQIPASLHALVMRMLDKDPRKRPRSIREIIDELDGSLNETLTFDLNTLTEITRSPSNLNINIANRTTELPAVLAGDSGVRATSSNSGTRWSPGSGFERRNPADRRIRRTAFLAEPDIHTSSGVFGSRSVPGMPDDDWASDEPKRPVEQGFVPRTAKPSNGAVPERGSEAQPGWERPSDPERQPASERQPGSEHQPDTVSVEGPTRPYVNEAAERRARASRAASRYAYSSSSGSLTSESVEAPPRKADSSLSPPAAAPVQKPKTDSASSLESDASRVSGDLAPGARPAPKRRWNRLPEALERSAGPVTTDRSPGPVTTDRSASPITADRSRLLAETAAMRATVQPSWREIPLDGLPRVDRLEPIRPRRWPWVLGLLAGVVVALYLWLPLLDPRILPGDLSVRLASVQSAIASLGSGPESAQRADSSGTAETQPDQPASGEAPAASAAAPAIASGPAGSSTNTATAPAPASSSTNMAMAPAPAGSSTNTATAPAPAGSSTNTAMAPAPAGSSTNTAMAPTPASSSASPPSATTKVAPPTNAAARRSQSSQAATALADSFPVPRRAGSADRHAAAPARKTANINGVMPLLTDAESAEAVHDYGRAAQDYSQALFLDPANATAKAGLGRANAAFGTDNYARAVGAGFAALGAGRLDEAHEDFVKARSLRPYGPEASEGLRRVSAALTARGFASIRQRATGLEAQERWNEAEQAYAEMLNADPSLSFAQIGKARAASRAELGERLQQLIDQPDRLSSFAAREVAASLLRTAEAQTPSGPVLRSQIAQLDNLLPGYNKPVRLLLLSDNSTQVAISSIGSFGAFSRRDIELKPGKYTVVGTRSGFREVRREITVAPGQDNQTIRVTCSEPI